MVKKYQLKNGLKVLLVESHKSPVVSVQMWVNTGSADERKGEEGISHFIEHLVFKGTEKFAVGEIAKTVEGSGGELNAYTSFDQTVFYVTISKSFTNTGLEVISQMMGFPQFDAAEIDKEREVVIEEIKRSFDSPHRQASRALFETVYKKHPYSEPVIGYEQIVRTVTPKKLRQYYNDRYSPANMTLLIAGDFNSKNIKADIQKLFGRIPKTKVRKISRKPESRQTGPRIRVDKTKFQESFLYLAWPATNAKDKLTPAIDALGIILGQGESSRLVNRLRNERGLVTSVGAGGFTPKDRGLFAISMTLSPDKLQVALEETLSILKDILSTPASAQELMKSVRSIESEKYYSMQTVDGLSQLLGNFEFYFGNPRHFDKQLRSFEKLKSRDILSAARKLLDPKQLNAIYLSKEVSPATDKIIQAWIVQYRKVHAAAIKSKAIEPKTSKRKKISWSIKKLSSGRKEPKVHQLKGGVRAIILRAEDTPVVNVKCAFIGGLRSEIQKEQGVSELLSRVWTAGTSRRSESVINAQIDSLAARISAFGGRNTTGLSMTALSSFALDTFDIYKELMAEPLFSDEAIEREKRVMLEQLKNRDDSPAQICVLNMMREMFGSHPYHRDPLGTAESVTALSRASVRAQHEKINHPENLVFSIVGDVDPDVWLEQIEQLTKKLNWSDSKWPPIEETNLTANRETFTKLEREQSHIVLAFPGLTLKDPRRRSLDVMQSILAGQGGRLFLELRDKESLAYSVSPMRFEGVDGGYFGTYIGCSPEKKDKAIKMMRAELDKLKSNLVPEDEILRAKRYVVGKHDISIQKGSSIANDMLLNEIYGLPFDEYKTFADDVQKVTSKDVKDLAGQLFSQPWVLSVVGKE